MLGMLDASAKAAVDLHVDEKHLALSRTGRAVRELCDARQPGCAREPARIDEAVLHALSEVEVVPDKVENSTRTPPAQEDPLSRQLHPQNSTRTPPAQGERQPVRIATMPSAMPTRKPPQPVRIRGTPLWARARNLSAEADPLSGIAITV
ncbi:hypothetical protein T492DRAFT_914718 [Pavlovales sp. CCMP2436]|nr:hypothetical protein T492DRAFT_914718 [Pavlovales sp. CCMP2436]